jgi:predicted DNA-binding transcriptional regulator YafY
MDSMRLSKTQKKLRIHPNFQPADFFKQIIGLFRSTGAAEKIVFTISENSWIKEYVNKYPIHPSQKKQTENTFELILEINQELENFFLRYSTELQVIEPLFFRKNLREKLKKALQAYQ